MPQNTCRASRTVLSDKRYRARHDFTVCLNAWASDTYKSVATAKVSDNQYVAGVDKVEIVLFSLVCGTWIQHTSPGIFKIMWQLCGQGALRVQTPHPSLYSITSKETKHPTEEIWEQGPTQKWDSGEGLVNHMILTCCSSVTITEKSGALALNNGLVEQVEGLVGNTPTALYGKNALIQRDRLATTTL